MQNARLRFNIEIQHAWMDLKAAARDVLGSFNNPTDTLWVHRFGKVLVQKPVLGFVSVFQTLMEVGVEWTQSIKPTGVVVDVRNKTSTKSTLLGRGNSLTHGGKCCPNRHTFGCSKVQFPHCDRLGIVGVPAVRIEEFAGSVPEHIAELCSS